MPTIAPDKNAVSLIDWQQNDLYRFFAFVFAPPTRECFDLLSQPGLAGGTTKSMEGVGVRRHISGIRMVRQLRAVRVCLYRAL